MLCTDFKHQPFLCQWKLWNASIILATANKSLHVYNRKNLLEEDMNHMECIQMMMQTAMRLVLFQSAPIVLEMVVFLRIWGRPKMWQKSSIDVLVPTGQKGKKAFWVCRTY